MGDAEGEYASSSMAIIVKYLLSGPLDHINGSSIVYDMIFVFVRPAVGMRASQHLVMCSIIPVSRTPPIGHMPCLMSARGGRRRRGPKLETIVFSISSAEADKDGKAVRVRLTRLGGRPNDKIM